MLLRLLLPSLLAVLLLVGCSTGPARDVGDAASRTPVATSSAATPSPTPEATPSPTVEPLPLADGAVNVLLLGTDSRDPASLTGNADTIILMHIPADREKLHLISFTRDMWVPIPGLGEGKINSAYARGGTDTLVATISGMLGGLEIDHVVQTNFNGFIALTRWLEGFEVENQHHSEVTVLSTGRHVVFEEGPIWLENTDGLIYVRERKRLPYGDLDRTERQRAALIGMMGRLTERLSEDPEDFPALVASLYGNVKVTGGLEVEDFVGLVPLMESLTRDDVVSLMVPVTGFGTVNGQSVNLVDKPQVAALGEALRSDTMDGYVSTWGTDYTP